MQKNMKNLLFCLLSILAWASCQNNPAPETTEATNNNRQAPGAVNQDSLIATKTLPQGAKMATESNLVGISSGTITGSNVTMRQAATVQSEKTGSFEDKEIVEVLGSTNVQNEGEAILSKPITVKGSGGTVKLPKGKAVVIENYQAGQNTYSVTYEDPQKGKLTAQIDAGTVETIIYASWYQVKRKSGETGWVLGKFLKTN